MSIMFHINHVTRFLQLKTVQKCFCLFISRRLRHPVSFWARINSSQTLWMLLPVSVQGSPQPRVPSSSKAFVQFQKIHRIIHLVFRTVHHSFSNTSPELNPLLRQSEFGLLENGSHNRKQQSITNGIRTEQLRHFFLWLHFFTRYLSKIISLLNGLQVNQSFFTSYNFTSGFLIWAQKLVFPFFFLMTSSRAAILDIQIRNAAI